MQDRADPHARDRALLPFSRRGRRRNPQRPQLDRRLLPGVSVQRLTIVSE
jgi:hypothetical protein